MLKVEEELGGGWVVDRAGGRLGNATKHETQSTMTAACAGGDATKKTLKILQRFVKI